MVRTKQQSLEQSDQSDQSEKSEKSEKPAINYSKVSAMVEILVIRKIPTQPGNIMYQVILTRNNREYYLVIKGDDDPVLKEQTTYNIAICEGDKEKKRLYATIPVQFKQLNVKQQDIKQDVRQDELEADVISATELQEVEERSYNQSINQSIDRSIDRSLYQGRAELPSIEEIDKQIERYEYVKNRLITDDDQLRIGNKKYTTKSGWRKFINAFGLSIELIDKRVFEQDNDKHAEVRVRAIAPNGQSVEGLGIKSMSNVFGNKTLHNLVATAWTKAVNRAVSDLVAFGAVSAEEMQE